MSQHFVTWSIDIEADTPKAAAEEALKIQRNPGSIATVFEVIDQDGKITQVDLFE